MKTLKVNVDNNNVEVISMEHYLFLTEQINQINREIRKIKDMLSIQRQEPKAISVPVMIPTSKENPLEELLIDMSASTTPTPTKLLPVLPIIKSKEEKIPVKKLTKTQQKYMKLAEEYLALPEDVKKVLHPIRFLKGKIGHYPNVGMGRKFKELVKFEIQPKSEKPLIKEREYRKIDWPGIAQEYKTTKPSDMMKFLKEKIGYVLDYKAIGKFKKLIGEQNGNI